MQANVLSCWSQREEPPAAAGCPVGGHQHGNPLSTPPRIHTSPCSTPPRALERLSIPRPFILLDKYPHFHLHPGFTSTQSCQDRTTACPRAAQQHKDRRARLRASAGQGREGGAASLGRLTAQLSDRGESGNPFPQSTVLGVIDSSMRSEDRVARDASEAPPSAPHGKALAPTLIINNGHVSMFISRLSHIHQNSTASSHANASTTRTRRRQIFFKTFRM